MQDRIRGVGEPELVGDELGAAVKRTEVMAAYCTAAATSEAANRYGPPGAG